MFTIFLRRSSRIELTLSVCTLQLLARSLYYLRALTLWQSDATVYRSSAFSLPSPKQDCRGVDRAFPSFFLLAPYCYACRQGQECSDSGMQSVRSMYFMNACRVYIMSGYVQGYP